MIGALQRVAAQLAAQRVGDDRDVLGAQQRGAHLVRVGGNAGRPARRAAELLGQHPRHLGRAGFDQRADDAVGLRERGVPVAELRFPVERILGGDQREGEEAHRLARERGGG